MVSCAWLLFLCTFLSFVPAVLRIDSLSLFPAEHIPLCACTVVGCSSHEEGVLCESDLCFLTGCSPPPLTPGDTCATGKLWLVFLGHQYPTKIYSKFKSLTGARNFWNTSCAPGTGEAVENELGVTRWTRGVGGHRLNYVCLTSKPSFLPSYAAVSLTQELTFSLRTPLSH